MYTVTLASWLSVYLAERSSRFDYQQVWHSSDPLRLILAVWSISLNFDHIRRTRVQRKMFRFIDTSYLLSTRRPVIRVATHSLVVVRHVKRMLRVLLAAVRRNHYHELSFILQHRTKVVQAAGPKLKDLLRSHVSLAKDFSIGTFANLDRQ